MTKEEKAVLVDEGFEITKQLQPLEKRLGEIKQVLAGAANGEPCELLGNGCKAKIGFVRYLDKTVCGPKEQKARELAGQFFETLFCRAPITDFKKVAKAVLGKDNSGKLIKLLSGLPGPRVSFEEA